MSDRIESFISLYIFPLHRVSPGWLLLPANLVIFLVAASVSWPQEDASSHFDACLPVLP